MTTSNVRCKGNFQIFRKKEALFERLTFGARFWLDIVHIYEIIFLKPHTLLAPSSKFLILPGLIALGIERAHTLDIFEKCPKLRVFWVDFWLRLSRSEDRTKYKQNLLIFLVQFYKFAVAYTFLGHKVLNSKFFIITVWKQQLLSIFCIFLWFIKILM